MNFFKKEKKIVTGSPEYWDAKIKKDELKIDNSKNLEEMKLWMGQLEKDKEGLSKSYEAKMDKSGRIIGSSLQAGGNTVNVTGKIMYWWNMYVHNKRLDETSLEMNKFDKSLGKDSF